MTLYHAKHVLIGTSDVLNTSIAMQCDPTINTFLKLAEKSLCEILTDIPFVGMQYRNVKAYAESVVGSPAGCVAALIDEIFRRTGIPLKCDTVGKLKDWDNRLTFAISAREPNQRHKYIYCTLHTEKCIVPKVIESSPTDGLKITGFSLSQECCLKDLIDADAFVESKITELFHCEIWDELQNLRDQDRENNINVAKSIATAAELYIRSLNTLENKT